MYTFGVLQEAYADLKREKMSTGDVRILYMITISYHGCYKYTV